MMEIGFNFICTRNLSGSGCGSASKAFWMRLLVRKMSNLGEHFSCNHRKY
jgi:hypothetical protein